MKKTRRYLHRFPYGHCTKHNCIFTFSISKSTKMLDPLTALSLAGTIIQLVDFGSKIVTHTLVISSRDGGSTNILDELHLVTSELQVLCTKLEQPRILVSPISPAETSLENLRKASAVLTDELLTKLNRLNRPGSKQKKKWKVFADAVMMAWNEDALLALGQRLSNLREAMETFLVLALRYASPLDA